MKIDIKVTHVNISDFDEEEAYQIGRALELESIERYQKLLEGSNAPEVSSVLSTLIAEERGHVARLESMIRRIGGDPKEVNVVEFIDTGAFPNVSASGLGTNVITSGDTVALLGIFFEELSVSYYKELANHTRSEGGKAAVAELIREEERHLEQFRALRQQLTEASA